MRKNYKEEILAARDRGLSYGQIAQELGCSKSTISYYLGSNQRAKNVQRSQRRRSDIRQKIAEIKEAVGCVDCGIKYPYYVLDFDHLTNDNKVDNIAKMVTYLPVEEILREIDKCEVVCANCHRERTFKRSQK